MIKIFWIITLVALWCLSSAVASVIYVDSNNPNNPGSGTIDDPFRRIQDGINAAVNGDTVLIIQGVYSGSGNYDLDPDGKSITISSIDPNDPDIIARTTIDPQMQGRGFIIQRGEDANCIISGLTITNAFAASGNNGAGIYCFNSSPVIRNCIIKNNYAVDGSGGGICFDNSSAAVINSVIADNSAGNFGYGGGLSCRFAAPSITGCTLSGNNAAIEGGGIDVGMSEPNIFNCIITDNNAPFGGGVNCYYQGNPRIVNCTIVANSSDYIGGGIHCWYNSNIVIENTILWANSSIEGPQLGLEEQGAAAITYSNMSGGQMEVYDPCGLLVWGQGNLDSNPCFVSFEPNGDPNLWDFHLQSKYGRWNSSFYRIDFSRDGLINLSDFSDLAGVWLQDGALPEDLDYSGLIDWMDLELFTQNYLTSINDDGWITDEFTSPCIDAGNPVSDWSQEPWPDGKRVNTGAFGGTIQASKSGNIADLNIDGLVNFIDLAELGNLWGENQDVIEDLDNNGIVDLGDLEIIAENWLWERN